MPLILFLLLGSAEEVSAFSVAINANSYQGGWRIDGISDFTNGSATFDLNPGKYNIYIGSESVFSFIVDASGDVSAQNIFASGGLGSLTFNTIPVTINTNNYEGNWMISHVTDFASGPVVVDLIPGLSYRVYIGTHGEFTFHVNADGTITNVSNPNAAQGALNQINFKTVAITVDPVEYPGNWMIAHLTSPEPGPQTLHMLTGLSYSLYIGSLSLIQIAVAADGTVTNNNSSAIQTGMKSITFRNVDLNINVSNYAGYWRIDHVSDYGTSNLQLKVVPGLNFLIRIAALGQIQFSVAANGTVTINNSTATSVRKNTIALKTVQTNIKPNSEFAGTWQIPYIMGDSSGAKSVTFVAGLNYQLNTSRGDIGQIAIDSRGRVSSVSANISDIFSGLNVIQDSDNDGIPDDEDLCTNTKVKKFSHVDAHGCTPWQAFELFLKQLAPHHR